MTSTSAPRGTMGARRSLTRAYERHRRRALGETHEDFDAESLGRGTSRLLDAALGGGRSDDAVTIDVPTRIGGGPRWVERCDEASRNVERIRENLRALRDAHAKALLPNFEDVGAEDVVAESLTKEVTKLFKRCDVTIRGVSETGETGDEKVVTNAQRKLAMELQSLSQEFRKMQKEYLAKLKSQQDRGPGAAGLDSYAQFSGGVGTSESARGGGGDLMRMEMLNRAETTSIERDREVMKILESVRDLGGVMKDLSALIIDQGTLLDRIDYNCETVAATVEEGRKELVQAEKSQKQSMAIMCIYILLVMVVFMIFIVIGLKS